MTFQEKTDDEIIRSLEYAGRTPPLALIRVCLERQAALTPRLLEIFEESMSDAWEDTEDPRWYRQVHTGKLLIAYREPAALPIFEKMFTLMDWDELEMLESFELDLANYGPEAVPMLTRVMHLETDGEYHYGRSLAIGTLAVIAHQHPEVRDEIIASLRALLPPLKEDGTPDVQPDNIDEVWSSVVMALGDLQDEDSRDHIERLFQHDLIDDTMLSLEDYQSSFAPDAESTNDLNRQFDIIAVYQDFHHQKKRQEQSAFRRQLLADQGFTPPSPQPESIKSRLSNWANDKIIGLPKQQRIGRNDPCPCGSGLKYKKCHGKPGAPPLP